jgi:hypothetical protein
MVQYIGIPRYHDRYPEINRLQNEINQLNQQINSYKSVMAAVQSFDDGVRRDIATDNATIADLTTKIATLTITRDNLIAQLTQLQYELEMRKESVAIDQTYINSEIDQLNDINRSTVNTQKDDPKFTKSVFNNIKSENNVIKKHYSDSVDDYQTGLQKDYYQTELMNTVSRMNLYMFIFYYILVFILILVFYFIQKTMPLRMKLIWISVLVVYPFLVMYIEDIVSYLIVLFLQLFQTKVPS